MLLEFAIQNFKSFKELQVFSLEASNEREYDDNIRRVAETKGGAHPYFRVKRSDPKNIRE